MKNIFSPKASLCTLTLCLSICCGNASAQIYVPATLPDNFWYSPCGPGSYNAGFNTAAINFHPAVGSTGTLMVSDYYGNATKGGLVCTDLATGYTVAYPYCGTGFYIPQQPDIIVGNDAQHPLTDFRVAVAYPDEIDFFLVHYFPGYLTFSLTYITSLALPVVSANVVHIDVIAQAGNTTITGFPFCDKYVVVCDGPGGTVNAAYGSLNSLGGYICTMPPVSVGAEPDVAAIQRKMLCPSGSCIDDIALIVYNNSAQDQLQYMEYDFTACAILLPPAPLGTPYTSPGAVYMPRIDAPDDYTINFPTPGKSFYKVVAQLFGSDVVTDDNQMVGTSWPLSAAPIPLSNYLPSVAFGGNGSTQYQVAQYNYPTPTLVNVYMEPIDWTNPHSLALPLDYYQVNFGAIGPLSIGFYDLTSISTPCNDPGYLTLVAWSYTDPVTFISNAFYKTTPYAYAFREPQQPTPSAPVLPLDWRVYPNPAATALTASSPGGTYGITDMLGRTVLNGELTAGSQIIDISSLTSGSYIFTGYKGESRDYNSVFVKQ